MAQINRAMAQTKLVVIKEKLTAVPTIAGMMAAAVRVAEQAAALAAAMELVLAQEAEAVRAVARVADAEQALAITNWPDEKYFQNQRPITLVTSKEQWL